MLRTDMKNEQAIIDMKNVGIRYDQGPEILSDINVSLKRGSFHFLTGKSGAGKTSLLSMMCLALLRRRIGVVFQDFRLIEHLSAFDNVALPLRVCGMSEREVRKRVKELLQWVELDKHMLDKTSTLSGGEKQRIAIARAVINRPDILLADEPTGNVDSDIAVKLMKLFIELNKLGTTVIIATHSEKLVNDFSYPRLHLQNGGLKVFMPREGLIKGAKLYD